jgi:hypothetical protein
MSAEQAADGPDRDLEADLEKFTADAQVAPARVIVSQAQDQRLDLGRQRRTARPTRSLAKGCPAPAHQFAMPAEQGDGRETQAIDWEVRPEGGEDEAIDRA